MAERRGQRRRLRDPRRPRRDRRAHRSDARRAHVPEQSVSLIKVGQPVRVAVDAYPGEMFKATVRFVSPSLRADQRALTVEAVAPNPDGRLKPGLFATALDSAAAVRAGAPRSRDRGRDGRRHQPRLRRQGRQGRGADRHARRDGRERRSRSRAVSTTARPSRPSRRAGSPTARRPRTMRWTAISSPAFSRSRLQRIHR